MLFKRRRGNKAAEVPQRFVAPPAVGIKRQRAEFGCAKRDIQAYGNDAVTGTESGKRQREQPLPRRTLRRAPGLDLMLKQHKRHNAGNNLILVKLLVKRPTVDWGGFVAGSVG